MEGANIATGEIHMSKQRSWEEYLKDMIKAIDKILLYVEHAGSLEAFMKNEMIMDAVARNYEIIGEAANKIPKQIQDKYPNVPWQQMYGLRNFAIHEYHIIDPVILWEIAQDHLVQNKIDLEEVLNKEFDV